jgi:hypothetical protein
LAGIQEKKAWIPAFAGMTAEYRTPICVELSFRLKLILGCGRRLCSVFCGLSGARLR